MRKKNQRDQHRLIREVHVLGAVLAFSTSAYAVDSTLSSLGQSGGLTIPSGFVLVTKYPALNLPLPPIRSDQPVKSAHQLTLRGGQLPGKCKHRTGHEAW